MKGCSYEAADIQKGFGMILDPIRRKLRLLPRVVKYKEQIERSQGTLRLLLQ